MDPLFQIEQWKQSEEAPLDEEARKQREQLRADLGLVFSIAHSYQGDAGDETENRSA